MPSFFPPVFRGHIFFIVLFFSLLRGFFTSVSYGWSFYVGLLFRSRLLWSGRLDIDFYIVCILHFDLLKYPLLNYGPLNSCLLRSSVLKSGFLKSNSFSPDFLVSSSLVWSF